MASAPKRKAAKAASSPPAGASNSACRTGAPDSSVSVTASSSGPSVLYAPCGSIGPGVSGSGVAGVQPCHCGTVSAAGTMSGKSMRVEALLKGKLQPFLAEPRPRDIPAPLRVRLCRILLVLTWLRDPRRCEPIPKIFNRGLEQDLADCSRDRPGPFGQFRFELTRPPAGVAQKNAAGFVQLVRALSCALQAILVAYEDARCDRLVLGVDPILMGVQHEQS